MKTVIILKKLIGVYYYLLLLGFICMVVVIPFLFRNGEIVDLNIIEGYGLSRMNTWKWMGILFVVASIYALFVRAIYLLKGSLNDLSSGNYFSELVIKNFNRIGKLFLICGIGFSAFRFALRLVLLRDIKLGMDNVLMLSVIIGLFFMFLSEVFAKAGRVQEENDLTI